MLALAFAIERVILRHMVNQEQIILFMATIGLTFFLEGFGETLWGSNVKVLDIGIPDAAAQCDQGIAIAPALLIAVFVGGDPGAPWLSSCMWRARAVRRGIGRAGQRSGVASLPGPGALVAVGAGARLLPCALRVLGADAAFIQGKASKTAMFLAALSWTGLAMMLGVGSASAAAALLGQPPGAARCRRAWRRPCTTAGSSRSGSSGR